MAAGPPSGRSGLAFGILGPLEVLLSGHEVPLAGSRQRALLAYLLLHANAVVSSERLIDELFGDEPPDNALNSVHTGISRLRRQLAAAGVTEVPILTRAPGYVLEIDRDQLDLHRFEDLLNQGRQELASGDPSAAAETLHQALDLWRGPALADLSSYEFARTEAARLEELRLAALSARIEADLALGRHTEVIGELELLTTQHPLQEGVRAQLMLALYRSGRQADALQVYQDTRRALVSELGLEPGKQLQQLEQAVLTQDPELDAPARRDGVLPGLDKRRFYVGVPAAVVLVAAVALAFLLLRDDAQGLVAQPNSVAVIDTASNRVTDVVGVGSRPGPLSAGFGAVWASNLGDSTVARIDTNTARVTRVVTLERPANGLAAGGGFLWAFASDTLLLPRPGVVDRIDPRYGVVIDTARIPYVIGAGGVAYGSNAAWVAPPLGLLTRLDTRTNEPVSTVDTGGSPTAVSVGAGAVWVTHPEAGTVVRVDPESKQASLSIPVGTRPVALAATGRTVWVVDDATDTLVEIDSATNTVRGSVAVGRRPSAVVASADGVWVANSGEGTVTRVNPGTRAVEAVIRVGGAPSGLAIAGRRVWVSVAPPAAATSAAEGGVVRATAEGPLDSLDPALATSTPSWQIEHATCLKLVNHPDRPPPAGSRLVPDAASGIPRPLSGGTTYVFRIRPGLRFSPPSNQLVTALTFKETIERAANPRLRGYGGSYVGDIVGMDAYTAGRAPDVDGIDARGDVLRIRLRAPAPDLLARLAMPFFCAVPTGTPVDPEGLDVIPSAGPFYVASYEPEHSVVLRRNPGYRGPRPQGAQEIRITLGVPRERGLQAVLRGESDYALDGVPPAEATSLRRQFPRRFYESPQIQLGFVALNTSRPLFSSPRLRRAAALAVDRRELALGGAGHTSPSATPTDQYLPPGMQGFRDVEIYPLRPDLARARRLAPSDSRFGVLYTCNLPFCVRQATIFTRDLKAIGIGLVVERFAIPELLERLGRRREPFDVAIPPGWFADFLDPAQYLNVLLDGRGIQAEQNLNFAYYDVDAYVRRLARIERLAGVRRVLAYGELDVETARDSAPLIAYANATRLDFFSERIGCQAYNPAYGMSLAALCLRKRTD